MTDYPDRQLAPGPPNSLDEKWYKWAGVPVGASYSQADQMVSEAVGKLQRERDMLLNRLRKIDNISMNIDNANLALVQIRQITLAALKGE